jgi:hypothetical protein
MSIQSHKSPISALLEKLDAWRKGLGWSRETVAAEIVVAHERIGGPARTGIAFEPRTTDVFKRMHTDAARIFRWFDDASKDTNLLNVNFLPSVLEAMPEDLRIQWLNDFLRPLNLCVRGVEQAGSESLDVLDLLGKNLKETAEANQALAEYAAHPTKAGLVKVEMELAQEVEVAEHALAEVRSVLGTQTKLQAVRAA